MDVSLPIYSLNKGKDPLTLTRQQQPQQHQQHQDTLLFSHHLQPEHAPDGWQESEPRPCDLLP